MLSKSTRPLLRYLAVAVLVVQSPATATPLLSEAEKLYQSKEYGQAAKVFSQALANTDDADLRQQCVLRLGDCIQVGWLEGWGTSDSYFASVVDQGYSPYLLQAFRKWRASYQEVHHGKTNHGQTTFPENEFYNQRKAVVLKWINDYLKDHPDDVAALAQRDGLEHLADIEAGPLGTTILNEAAELWPEFGK